MALGQTRPKNKFELQYVGPSWAIAAHPQTCLRGDRASVLEQWSLPLPEALRNELRHGRRALAHESMTGAKDFLGRPRDPRR